MERIDNAYLDLVKLLVLHTSTVYPYKPRELDLECHQLEGYSKLAIFEMGVAQGENLLAQKALILLEQINLKEINEVRPKQEPQC